MCGVQVISVVRGLVKRGITICATIHCPPPHTFTLFDRALIMQRGRVVYFGLNGQPAIDYFYNHFDKVSSTRALSHLKQPSGITKNALLARQSCRLTASHHFNEDVTL